MSSPVNQEQICQTLLPLTIGILAGYITLHCIKNFYNSTELEIIGKSIYIPQTKNKPSITTKKIHILKLWILSLIIITFLFFGAFLSGGQASLSLYITVGFILGMSIQDTYQQGYKNMFRFTKHDIIEHPRIQYMAN